MMIHLLSLSLDQNLLDPKMGDVLARQQEYANHFAHTTILVLCRGTKYEVRSTEKLTIIPVNSWSRFDLLPKTYSLASKTLQKHPIQLITTQDPLATGLVGTWLKKKFNIPLNIQIHNDFFTSEKGLRRSLLHYCLKRADSIRVVSEKLKSSIVNDLTIKLPGDPTIFVAPVRVNLDLFWQPAHYKPKITKFISVGRLAPEKNFPLLIAAFREVLKTHPEVSLTIVGDGPEMKSLVSLTSKIPQVTLTGSKTTSEVASLLHQHHAFLLASKSEGWGMAYVEAFASGLPVITTPVAAVGELLQPDTNCLIASSTSDFVLRTSYLVDHPEEAYRLAKNGQMWVKNNLDSKILVNRWIDGLQKTVETT